MSADGNKELRWLCRGLLSPMPLHLSRTVRFQGSLGFAFPVRTLDAIKVDRSACVSCAVDLQADLRGLQRHVTEWIPGAVINTRRPRHLSTVRSANSALANPR